MERVKNFKSKAGGSYRKIDKNNLGYEEILNIRITIIFQRKISSCQRLQTALDFCDKKKE